MAAVRPLPLMLSALSWAALPCWPAGIAAAILWTGRAEMALLSAASSGTFAGAVLLILRRAEKADERAARRAAEYERLERLLVQAVAELRPEAARTRPGLRMVPRRPAGAPARR